jgi:LacI family transcriptional regulator
MSDRATIQDVANLAKVSKVTVSYVLNGQDAKARISAETKDRVLSAARELGYRRNAIARMLVTRKSQTIAIVFQYAQYFSIWSSFTSDVMHGVCEASVAGGFDLMLHTRPSENSLNEVDQLTDGRADGALVLRDSDDPLLDELLRREFPCVFFFTRSTVPGAAYVDADNYSGGRMAARHLLDLGHRRIAMIRGSAHSVSSNDRFNGYRDALESAGLASDPANVIAIESPDQDLGEFRSMMSRADRPTALFVWSDDVAFKCMQCLRDMGLELPKDVSIVGFDSIEACNHCSPTLTSVKQPIFEMARDATRILLGKINGEPPRRDQLVYPLTLEIRGSTAPPQ